MSEFLNEKSNQDKQIPSAEHQAQAGLQLERIVFLGRTFEEYSSMFNLTIPELNHKKILDCPGGACSFSAQAAKHGADTTAADIAYYFAGDDLYHKGRSDIDHMLISMETARDRYDWSLMRHPQHLAEVRLSALEQMVQDRRAFPQRYIAAQLPQLPFANQEFDLTLSAHFLFLYADRLDRDFHIATLRELMRVTANELRIFPLVTLEGHPVEYRQDVVEIAGEGQWVSQVQPTNYRFQQGAHELLILRRR
ncbi:SAM-dependent methyltransferase [Paenibacillus kandeliae]|uniref:SAM-dependent methyltransferase n=1 Tax=Paenibacillus kandeliae TaxID=3231269 RepID=UPI00345AEB68